MRRRCSRNCLARSGSQAPRALACFGSVALRSAAGLAKTRFRAEPAARAVRRPGGAFDPAARARVDVGGADARGRRPCFGLAGGLGRVAGPGRRFDLNTCVRWAVRCGRAAGSPPSAIRRRRGLSVQRGCAPLRPRFAALVSPRAIGARSSASGTARRRTRSIGALDAPISSGAARRARAATVHLGGRSTRSPPANAPPGRGSITTGRSSYLPSKACSIRPRPGRPAHCLGLLPRTGPTRPLT